MASTAATSTCVAQRVDRDVTFADLATHLRPAHDQPTHRHPAAAMDYSQLRSQLKKDSSQSWSDAQEKVRQLWDCADGRSCASPSSTSARSRGRRCAATSSTRSTSGSELRSMIWKLSARLSHSCTMRACCECQLTPPFCHVTSDDHFPLCGSQLNLSRLS